MDKNIYTLSEKSKTYLEQYIQLTNNIILDIEKHMTKYQLCTDICAYYKNMDDFFSDWCSIGYTKNNAKKLLKENPDEFMKLPYNLGYIRFEK